MAGTSFGGKILNFLSRLFQTISSPISGFDVYDVQAKQNGDNFSSLFKFNTAEDGTVKDTEGKEITDIKGNKIEVDILLQTLNAATVLNSIFEAINRIGDDNFTDQDKQELLTLLFGSPDVADFHYFDDDSKKNGDGLLGYKFSAVNTEDNIFRESWGHIMENMKFGLECQSPGRDYGAIEGKNLKECGNLVAEYLEKVGVVTTRNEVKIDYNSLVIPILKLIQQTLGEHWNDALAKYLGDNGESENPEGNSEENGQDNNGEGEQNNPPAPENNNGEGGMMTSKHIDVTLQKITGTTRVKMTAIKANYGFGEVLDDIDEIINQEEFIEALPEVPTSYAVDVDDDGFDIEPCEECIKCDPCESLAEIFKAGIRAYRNLYIIHWMARGNDMMKLHLLSEDMYAELIQEIDTLGELLVEKCGSVPQLDFPCDYIAVQDYDFQTGLDVIQSFINMYIDCIDYAYCNQDSDVQSTLDEWLRYWKKQLKYFVERQEV